MDTTGHELLRGSAAECFPLLPRPRPPCLALRDRIDEIGKLTRSASQGISETRLSSAAEALNKAALIASDCGLPDLARQLCWRQFDTFHAATPLTVQAAKFALQPIVNLGRLHIRSGHTAHAYQIFHNAYQAMTSQSATMIDGRHIDLGHLVDQDEHRQELGRFLWSVLLADGTRALAQAGQWGQALRHLEQHRGIGTRMLDGRQVAILARATSGDCDGALDMLDDSDTPEPWEQAVAGCIRTLCLRVDGRAAGSSAAAMVSHYRQLDRTPGHLAFRTRLGLCVLDLTDGPGKLDVATRIVSEAVASADGHVAWDVLSHPSRHLSLTEADKNTLVEAIESSGLHRGSLPGNLLDDLMTSARTSQVHLAQRLGRRRSPCRRHPCRPSTASDR